MKHRPFSILLLSIGFFTLCPLHLLIWFFYLKAPTANLQWLVPIFSALGLFVGVGIWQVRKWGYFLFHLYSVSVLASFLYAYIVLTDTSMYLYILVGSATAAICGVLLQKHVSAPYFNPKLRWWEHDPRYRVQLAAKFQIDRQARQGTLLDISRGGCFADLDTKLIVGEEIEVRLSLLKFDFTTRAKVIWHSDSPHGYGLMFLGLTKRNGKEIDQIIKYLIDSMGDLGPRANKGIHKAV